MHAVMHEVWQWLANSLKKLGIGKLNMSIQNAFQFEQNKALKSGCGFKKKKEEELEFLNLFRMV